MMQPQQPHGGMQMVGAPAPAAAWAFGGWPIGTDWRDYSPADSERLENAFMRFYTTQDPAHRLCQLPGNMYCVDLQDFLQIRLDDHTKYRPVRRIGADGSCYTAGMGPSTPSPAMLLQQQQQQQQFLLQNQQQFGQQMHMYSAASSQPNQGYALPPPQQQQHQQQPQLQQHPGGQYPSQAAPVALSSALASPYLTMAPQPFDTHTASQAPFGTNPSGQTMGEKRAQAVQAAKGQASPMAGGYQQTYSQQPAKPPVRRTFLHPAPNVSFKPVEVGDEDLGLQEADPAVFSTMILIVGALGHS